MKKWLGTFVAASAFALATWCAGKADKIENAHIWEWRNASKANPTLIQQESERPQLPAGVVLAEEAGVQRNINEILAPSKKDMEYKVPTQVKEAVKEEYPINISGWAQTTNRWTSVKGTLSWKWEENAWRVDLNVWENVQAAAATAVIGFWKDAFVKWTVGHRAQEIDWKINDTTVHQSFAWIEVWQKLWEMNWVAYTWSWFVTLSKSFDKNIWSETNHTTQWWTLITTKTSEKFKWQEHATIGANLVAESENFRANMAWWPNLNKHGVWFAWELWLELDLDEKLMLFGSYAVIAPKNEKSTQYVEGWVKYAINNTISVKWWASYGKWAQEEYWAQAWIEISLGWNSDSKLKIHKMDRTVTKAPLTNIAFNVTSGKIETNTSTSVENVKPPYDPNILDPNLPVIDHTNGWTNLEYAWNQPSFEIDLSGYMSAGQTLDVIEFKELTNHTDWLDAKIVGNKLVIYIKDGHTTSWFVEATAGIRIWNQKHTFWVRWLFKPY